MRKEIYTPKWTLKCWEIFFIFTTKSPIQEDFMV